MRDENKLVSGIKIIKTELEADGTRLMTVMFITIM